MRLPRLAALVFCAFPLSAALPAAASEFEPKLRALEAAQIAQILTEPGLIDAVRAQNTRTAALSAAEIDAADKTWRAEVGAAVRPTIDPVTTSVLAERLRTIRDGSGGLFTEIFVMDAVGLNVAASDVTSDYWQGDEAKWQDTFAKGAGAIHVSDVELDESTQTYQAQVSVTVTDPATGAAIGAATFGVNVELLP